MPLFIVDLILELAQKTMNPNLTEKEKIMETRVCVNVIRNAITHLENSNNVERRRRKMYKKGYHRKKEQYMDYKRKYEALVRKKNQEEEERKKIEKKDKWKQHGVLRAGK